jgi:superfamily II DNA/RNA helicase
MIEQVIKNLGISLLNEMQKATIEEAEKERELVLLSPTGSGKTLAFLLPILKVLKQRTIGVQALILAPSRELAIQIEGVFKKMSTGYKISCCYGGHSMASEIKNLIEAPAVLVGTPGRIADHLRRQSFDPGDIHILVLDEFDKALELGFQDEMAFIIKSLNNLTQKILTSATHSQEMPGFVQVKSPKILNFIKESKPAGLSLKAVRAEENDKLEALFKLVCLIEDSATLIFCNHREAVDRISELLKNRDLEHEVFHGGLEQDERLKALIKFRNGSNFFLVTTDLAARGLDIPEIKHIIHYQLPNNKESYIHRNGRTARMNAEGVSYLVLAQDEKLPEYLHEEPVFEDLPDQVVLPEPPPWQTLYISGGKKDKINKMDIVGFLIQQGKLEKEEIGLIEVLDAVSFVAVKRNKIKSLKPIFDRQKIKKKPVKIGIAR